MSSSQQIKMVNLEVGAHPGARDPAHPHAQATPEELVEFLEDVAGRRIQTRDALGDYLTELRAEGEAAKRSARVGKFGAWFVVLVMAILQYFVIEIFVEVNALRGSNVLTPVKATNYRT